MRRIALLAASFLLLAVPGARAWTWPAGGEVLRPFVFDPAHPYAGGQHRGIDISAALRRVDPRACRGRHLVRRDRPRRRPDADDPHAGRLRGDAPAPRLAGGRPRRCGRRGPDGRRGGRRRLRLPRGPGRLRPAGIRRSARVPARQGHPGERPACSCARAGASRLSRRRFQRRLLRPIRRRRRGTTSGRLAARRSSSARRAPGGARCARAFAGGRRSARCTRARTGRAGSPADPSPAPPVQSQPSPPQVEPSPSAPDSDPLLSVPVDEPAAVTEPKPEQDPAQPAAEPQAPPEESAPPAPAPDAVAPAPDAVAPPDRVPDLGDPAPEHRTVATPVANFRAASGTASHRRSTAGAVQESASGPGDATCSHAPSGTPGLPAPPFRRRATEPATITEHRPVVARPGGRSPSAAHPRKVPWAPATVACGLLAVAGLAFGRRRGAGRGPASYHPVT